MAKLEAIIFEQANRLSPVERELLCRHLSAQAYSDVAEDEGGVGKRGLAAWTESIQGEDWSMFYPDALRSGGASAAPTGLSAVPRPARV
jgi:hypothetical protein